MADDCLRAMRVERERLLKRLTAVSRAIEVYVKHSEGAAEKKPAAGKRKMPVRRTIKRKTTA